MRVNAEQMRTVLVPRFLSIDWLFLGLLIALSALGLVMVFSASIAQAERIHGTNYYFLQGQLMFLLLGLGAAAVTWNIPLRLWERAGPLLLVAVLVLLLAVLIPGIGKSVNGSQRWLQLGLSFQPSEAFKLVLIIYLAGYLVRKGDLIQKSFTAFLIPLGVAAFGGLLLMLEPDFGATVVIIATVVVMLFAAGARLLHILLVGCVLVPVGFFLVVVSPYRFARLMSFLHPWEDPFNSGFQLTQALIAIGRGGWDGVGLGNSVQKMAYLPEAHTDFVFAIVAEELGFIGVLCVVMLFAGIVYRCFRIASLAERTHNPFGVHLAVGIGFWLGLQAFINLGANTGLLPTKGITLPLFSYGGSSVLIVSIACGLVMRVFREGSVQMAQDSLRSVEKRLYQNSSDNSADSQLVGHA